MMKLLLLAFVVMMSYIVLHRQRVFVRDPLASVYRIPTKAGKLPGSNTGSADAQREEKQSGVQVYINYSNDVLLIKDDQPGAYSLLLQNWNRVPGHPNIVKCVHGMACLTDADHATADPVVPQDAEAPSKDVSMSSQGVSFVSADGSRIRVALR